METKKQKESPGKDSRSKIQLLKTLGETEDRLEQKELALARCNQELQGLRTKLDRTSLASADLKSLRAQLEKARKNNKSLQSKLNAQKGSHADVAEQLELALARIDDFEQKEKALHEKMQQLEDENQALKAKQSDPPSLPAHKAEEKEPEEKAPEKQQPAAHRPALTVTEGEGSIPFSQAAGATSEQRYESPAVQNKSALQATCFQQQSEVVKLDQPLQPWQPFELCTRILLEHAPVGDDLDELTCNYSIQVSTKSQDSGEVIFRDSYAGLLQSEQLVYEDRVLLPKTAPGRYTVEIIAIAPAAHLAALQQVEFLVANRN